MSKYEEALKAIGIDPTVFKGQEWKLISILGSEGSNYLVNYVSRVRVDELCVENGFIPTTDSQWSAIQSDSYIKEGGFDNNSIIDFILYHCTLEKK